VAVGSLGWREEVKGEERGEAGIKEEKNRDEKESMTLEDKNY
jgi:hypothetical protein